MTTRRFRMQTMLCLGLGLAGGTLAAEQPSFMTGSPSGNLLVGGSGRVMILAPDGKILWEHKAGLVHDAWMLPNGNVLYADGSVTEVTPDKKVVFQYKSENQGGGGAYGCQRLENGNTMVAENSTGRILEVDPAGKVVFTLQMQPAKPGDHNNMRIARKLKNGNYLVCMKGYNTLREVTPKGDTVLEIKTTNITFAAFRTPKNTTYVSTIDHVTEYDAAGKKVWEFANTDAPGTTITNMTGMHLLPNGNLAVGCYAAYKDVEGAGLFEITRDKKVVWRYGNPKADGSLMAIQVLDKAGKPLAGECLR
jgi:prepilin-type processing-associated H-X9-DG protein